MIELRDFVKVTGMVMKSVPSGEYDKRLVILTRERGKIVVFSKGARRPGNMLMAVSRPFSFGNFLLYEGRDSYNLQSAEISNYFEELSGDMEGTCFGTYFLEFADYYSRENVDETQMLKLLYHALRALLKPSIPNLLVLKVFELKTMVINGEYTEHPPKEVCESAHYTWEYVVTSPVESLYCFTVSEPVLAEFRQCVEINKMRYIDYKFHSLDILQTLTGDI